MTSLSTLCKHKLDYLPHLLTQSQLQITSMKSQRTKAYSVCTSGFDLSKNTFVSSKHIAISQSISLGSHAITYSYSRLSYQFNHAQHESQSKALKMWKNKRNQMTTEKCIDHKVGGTMCVHKHYLAAKQDNCVI